MQTSRPRQGEGWPQTAYGVAPISRLAETRATDAATQLHLQQCGAREDPLDGCGCAERDGGPRATSEPSSVRAFGTHGQAAEGAQAPLEAASEEAEVGGGGEWGGERAVIGGGELGGERRGQRRQMAADQRGQLVGGASVSAPAEVVEVEGERVSALEVDEVEDGEGTEYGVVRLKMRGYQSLSREKYLRWPAPAEAPGDPVGPCRRGPCVEQRNGCAQLRARIAELERQLREQEASARRQPNGADMQFVLVHWANDLATLQVQLLNL
eukprot:5921251-Pleurochrysis_carterae.AAC.1